MKKIVAFGASNSRKSINQHLANWVALRIENVEVQLLDLNNYEMPIFSIDREQESGIPQLAKEFKAILHSADALIISFAEHNGSYSAAFKNIYDWVSRIERGTWADKPTLLLATSPGPRGGRTVLETASRAFPRQGARVVGSFSLPSFGQNFDQDSGITDAMLVEALSKQLENLKEALHETVVKTPEVGL